MNWEGVLILQRKMDLFDSKADRSDGEWSYGAEYVSASFDGFGFPLSTFPPDGALRTCLDTVRERVSALFEARNPIIMNPFCLTPKNGEFLARIRKIKAPEGSIFRAGTITLFRVMIEG